MSLIKKIAPFLAIITTALSVTFCAKVGTISGGPKDSIPPILLGSEPQNFATNFKGKKIRLNFNEYVQLKEFNQQFNVSPPLKKKPKVWMNNKSVFLQYTDTLKDSTTYTMNFGNSLADNNEGNILENFEFVFSTTNYIDSMGVQGYVTDAFTGKASKDPFLVCLYSNLSDSAPSTTKPTFTGRTYKDGIFTINNVKNGKYRLYAFQDKNNNLKYDPVSEAFAYADTIVVLDPTFLASVMPAKNLQDSFLARKDSISSYINDSLKKEKLTIDNNKLMVELFSFYEKSKKQFLKDYNWKDRRKFTTSFALPLIKNELTVSQVFTDFTNWYEIEFGPNRDSLIFWITNENLMRIDTFRAIFSYLDVSPTKDTTIKYDTLKMTFSGIVPEKKKKESDTLPEKMLINSLLNGALDLNTDLILETNLPVNNFNTDKISFFEKVDTNFVPAKFEFFRDSVFPRKFHVKSNWQEQSSYKLIVYPGCFSNIYHLSHDTLNLGFSTQKSEFYGKFSIVISENKNRKMILQMLDKELVVYEKLLNGNGTVDFEFLKPGTYTLKAIYDENGDGEYTTGDFLDKRQAEKVSFYKESLTVRSNWETTIEWAPKFE